MATRADDRQEQTAGTPEFFSFVTAAEQIVERLDDTLGAHTRLNPLRDEGDDRDILSRVTDLILDSYELTGARVRASKFSFVNKAGGTGLSDSPRGEAFTGVAEISVTSVRDSQSTGHVVTGTAASPELIAYLDLHGSGEDRRVFFSQFDLL